jgi:hypothetical protein
MVFLVFKKINFFCKCTHEIPGQSFSSESSEQSTIPSHFQARVKHWSVVSHLNSSALQVPVGPPVGRTVELGFTYEWYPYILGMGEVEYIWNFLIELKIVYIDNEGFHIELSLIEILCKII